MRSASVYRCFDIEGHLLYVGHSTRVLGRLAEHSATKDWWKRVANVTVEHFDSRIEASTAEAAAIAAERPEMNERAGALVSAEHQVDGDVRCTIGKRIRASRRVVDLTQGALAEAVHVTQPAVSQWENGQTLPALPVQFAIADSLRTTRSRLFRELEVASTEGAA